MLQHAISCPVCSETLDIDANSLAKYKSVSCVNHHLFDFAKQGYLNLLLSQHKKSKHPGDTQEMVQARTQFLNKGFYNGIATFLITQCLPSIASRFDSESMANNSIVRYCDLACGEGFYTEKIHKALEQTKPAEADNQSEDKRSSGKVISTGLDISTPAIKAACQRSKSIQWLIASLSRIPLQDQSQDLATGLFFHFDLNEVARILKPNGHFIMVTTGPNHLIELRQHIYDVVKQEKIKDFSVSTHQLSYIKTITWQESKHLSSPADIQSLLAMTPHYWRCTQDKKQQIALLNELEVTLDIQFDIFSKPAHIT